MCGPSMGCGIYAIVRDGGFVRVEGMQEVPSNQGRLCPKAYAAPQWVYSPQRLKHPHGTMKMKAEIYPGIRPDTVMALHGWWQGCEELSLPDYPLLDGGANTNNMYSVDSDKAYDPLVTAMSSQTLVQVSKEG